jgi:hypothetical protein
MFPRSKGHLPRSDVNQMGPGWGCAQRRPLRALAHTLMLYSPEAVLLVDDDTFVNYHLLKKSFTKSILVTMQVEPLVFGEFSGSYSHLTKRGLFVGGSGYLIGKEAIRRLISYEVKYYNIDKDYKRMHKTEKDITIHKEISNIFKRADMSNIHDYARKFESVGYDNDRIRTFRQKAHLSVYIDAYLMGKSSCPGPCADFNPFKHPPYRAFPPSEATSSSNQQLHRKLEKVNEKVVNRGLRENWKNEIGLLSNGFLPIPIRLIDLCANMMAGENTCLHR